MKSLRGSFSVLMLLAFFVGCNREPPLDAAGVARAVLANEDWQLDVATCPAELVAEHENTDFLKRDHCADPRLGTCLSECRNNEAGSCYWLAIALQDASVDPRVSATLFQRACKLGVMSGCTNRAAGMHLEKADEPSVQSCVAATYEKVCGFEDPWACTMYAATLTRGIGGTIDTEKALKALEKSCKYGPVDEACSTAMQIKEEIEQMDAARPATE